MSVPQKTVRSNRFVGREREVAELEAALGEVLRGRGRLFLIAGEPGIGKTRLAEEIAIEARQRGARVSWGRAWESEGAPAYWPWIQILRGLLVENAPDRLREQIGVGLPYVAQLVPEIKQNLPEVADAVPTEATMRPSLGPDRLRFYLFDAVTRFMVNAAAERPQVFVLDDIHWADVPSLLLLRFLAREIKSAPVLILGTYRDVEARSEKQVGEILTSLSREGRVIHLGGLSELEVGRLVAVWDRDRASDEMVSNVYRATEGNPFFVEGILRLLASAPSSEPLGALPIPDEVRDAVRQRLQRLTEEARELLTAAAILGREFSHPVLVAASGVSPADILSLVDQARELAIVADTPTPHRWRFAHDLFREVLYGDLSPTRRMKLHERAGSALESLYGQTAREHAAELAAHFFAALPMGDAAKAIGYGDLAARQSMASYAWEDAVVELERVLAVLESDPAAGERQRLELLLDLGDAIWHSEDPARYREVFAEALALARKLSLPPELARAVLGLVGSAPPTGTVDDAKVALLEEALSALGEADLLLRGRLLDQLCWQTYFSTDRDRWQIVEECVQVALRVADPTLLVQALRRRMALLVGSPQKLPERIALAEEMLGVARRSGNRELLLIAEMMRIIIFFETGDIAALDAEIDSYSRGAKEVREPYHFWFSTALQTTRVLMAGRWEDAERLSAEALSAGLAVQRENATAIFGTHQFQLHYEQGRIANLVPSIREYVDRFPKIPNWRAALAVAYSELGQTREAHAELEVAAARGIENLPTDYMLEGLLAALTIVVSFVRDTARAQTLYARLLPFAGHNIMVGFGASCWGAADRFLGMLAGTLCRWEDASRHFDAALAINRRMGAAPLVARTQYEYAFMLLQRGNDADTRKAEGLLREAAAVARELGMARLLEVSEEALERVGTGPAAQPDEEALHTPAAVLRKEGDFWTISWKANTFRLKSSRGLAYIQNLIREPGRELHCVDILGQETVDLGDAGEVLDAGAKTAYRCRLEDLREDLAEAESNNDPGRATKAREEIELLGRELLSAVGLGGHDRRASANVERARISVTRSIRSAIARIGEHDASLGRHLSTAIRTGAFCSYNPDPTSPVTWES